MEIKTEYSSYDFINSSSSVKSTSETSFSEYLSKTQKNSETTNSKEIDYSNYSFEELKAIPYKEAKANIEKIKERKEELSLEEGDFSLMFQFGSLNFSNNEKVNKALYNTYQKLDDGEAASFSLNMQIGMEDYYHGKKLYAGFVRSNDNIHANTQLTKEQRNSINFEDFISKMLEVYMKGYQDSKGTVKEQYKEGIANYSMMQSFYQETKSQAFYG